MSARLVPSDDDGRATAACHSLPSDGLLAIVGVAWLVDTSP